MSLGSRKTTVTRLLQSKEYRDAYVLEHIKNGVAFQIRTLREDRDWTQGDLGDAMGKPRNVVSRLEDPNYGKTTLTTLRELAAAFDVGLLVKFVTFSRLVREYEDVSPAALSAPSITSAEEIAALKEWEKSEWEKEEGVPVSLGNAQCESNVIVLSEWASKHGIVAAPATTSAEPGATEPQQQVLFPDKPRKGKKSRRRRSASQVIEFSPPTEGTTSIYCIESAA